MLPKFFITHSHKDNVFVARLARDLRAAGFDGFLDIYSLKPGDLISREISRGLDACDYYLPVLSHAAMDSPWCELEIHTAITLSNEVGRSGRPRIIPLLVEECQARLDPFLRARLYLKFHENYDANFLLLLRAIGVGGAIGGIDPSAPLVQTEPKIVTPPPPKELASRITNKAGQEMILIPAGEFLMGTSDSDAKRLIQEYGKDYEQYVRWEQPQHPVYLDAFYISRYPVTNAEYKKFKSDWKIPNGKENHPVVNVSWDDARKYCELLTENENGRDVSVKRLIYRLPTEAESEKAASWVDSKMVKYAFPWGNAFDSKKCNSSEAGIGDTTHIGKYSPQGDSPYGGGDMAGNVQEWCADWFVGDYYKNPPRETPLEAISGEMRILRGGAFVNPMSAVRCAWRGRSYPQYQSKYIGFRVVVAPV